ncbi:MAG: AMIN domain-containing protein, partial [Nitrospinaceae bacterium]|nr:AMIN domain-containing protein [Nitrospinaceae bacterium]
MRKKMFKNPHLLKLIFLLLSLNCWPVVIAYSSALPGDHQFDNALLQGNSHEEKNTAPSIVLAQNQNGNSGNESFGEIIDLNTKKDGQRSIVSIVSTQPVKYTAFKLLDPHRLVLDFPKMDKGNLSSLIKVNEGIINSIRTIHFKKSGVLRLEIVLNQPPDYEIERKEENKLIVHLQSSELESEEELVKFVEKAELSIEEVNKKDDTTSIASKNNEDSRDTCYPMLYGEKEKVNLDFQNTDVRNLFRIFAEISDLNVIISPEVKGFVNVKMKDVAWNEAMKIILTNSGLGRECFGNNIIRIVTKTVLAAEEGARIAKKLRAVTDKNNEKNIQDLVTEVVRINLADITELATSLSGLKSTRPDARITVDTRTNTLILNDLRKHVNNMLDTIKVLDLPTPQVLIEAKIVEISKSYTEELGVQWGLAGELSTNTPGAAVLTQGPTATASTNENFIVDLTQTSNIDAGSVSGFSLLLGNLVNGTKLNIALEALETQGKGKVISSPKVTTADNKEAKISSGRKIPYQVTQAEGNSIQFVDAELSLTVVPHITSDDKIYMV